MKKFIDSLFSPIVQMLDWMIEQLNSISLVAAKGVRLDHYFGLFNIIGPQWIGVIQALISAILFLYVLKLVKAQGSLIIWLKGLIKWW